MKAGQVVVRLRSGAGGRAWRCRTLPRPRSASTFSRQRLLPRQKYPATLSLDQEKVAGFIRFYEADGLFGVGDIVPYRMWSCLLDREVNLPIFDMMDDEVRCYEIV
jgi:hypothetical protein